MIVRSTPQVRVGVLVLLAAVLLLNACSVAEITYNNGDWLAAHYADEYMDLDREQETALRARVVFALERNRVRDLPLYEAFLGNVRETVGSAIRYEDARSILQAAEVLFERLAEDMAALLAPTLSSLSAPQITHLEQALADSGQRLREKYLEGGAAARRQARAQRTVEYIEGWTGSLSHQQRVLVEDRSRALPYTTSAWLDYRAQQIQRLVELLRQGAENATIHAYLSSWWIRQEGKPSGAIRDDKAYVDGVLRLLARLDATLTPQQRARATGRMQNWVDTLQALQENARPVPVAREKLQFGDSE